MARSTRSNRRRSAGNVVSLDLSKVESRVKVDDGEYRVAVVEVTQEEGQAADYFKWKFRITEGDYEGGILYNNTSLAPQALWNLRTLLEALGVEIPDEAFELDLEELKGLELMVSVENESYEGKRQPRVVDFWPVEAGEETKSSRGSKAAEEEPEEDAEEDAEEEKPARTRSRSSRSAKEETKSARGGKGKAAKEQPALSQDEINDMSQEELEDVIEEYEFDLDLSEFKTLRKMRAAVIDAAEEAGVLED